MPVLFVGHGSPMNAILQNEFNEKWRCLAKDLPRPKAILCISAHWLTKGTFVTAMDNPRTIHDFGGFPQALFNVQYPAPGSPDIAKQVQTGTHFTDVHLDEEWGLDHGTWSVIRQMFPEADIPVVQLSIDYHQSPEWHYKLGQELAALRKQGVLIVGSGNMVHNLGMIDTPAGVRMTDDAFNQEHAYDWAFEMNDIFKQKILSREHQDLINYHSLSSAAKLAIPTPDHYYPLLYSLALQEKDDETVLFNDRCIGGSLSMTSVLIG